MPALDPVGTKRARGTPLVDVDVPAAAIDASSPAAPQVDGDRFDLGRSTTGPQTPAPRAPRAAAALTPALAPTVRRGLSAEPAAVEGGRTAPHWGLDRRSVDGSYDATGEVTDNYDFGKIEKDIPAIWSRPYAKDIRSEFRDAFNELGGKSNETYGELFKRIGAERGVDPYALASYCVFESYNSETGTFNPHMRQERGSMYAAGIAATQAQHVRGTKVPGLAQRLPNDTEEAADVLRASPEIAVRYLADEMKAAFENNGSNLARALPFVAFPAWRDPETSMGDYGTQAEYVSRAAVMYRAFAAADRATNAIALVP